MGGWQRRLFGEAQAVIWCGTGGYLVVVCLILVSSQVLWTSLDNLEVRDLKDYEWDFPLNEDISNDNGFMVFIR